MKLGLLQPVLMWLKANPNKLKIGNYEKGQCENCVIN